MGDALGPLPDLLSFLHSLASYCSLILVYDVFTSVASTLRSPTFVLGIPTRTLFSAR